MGNGSPLHLGTVPLKFFDQSVLDFFAGNELISADYTPGMNVNVRIDLLTGAGSNLDKMLICKEFPTSQLGNFPRLVTENGGIYIMVQGILGDQNISDVQSGIQGSCHTGVDDGSDLKKVCQNLYAESGIDFADTTADDDYGSTVQGTLVKFHICFGRDISGGHVSLESFHFQLHGTDDSDFFHVCFLFFLK